jgi:Rrf2 family iron-sulfur cluster assembly transcriptional regulator
MSFSKRSDLLITKMAFLSNNLLKTSVKSRFLASTTISLRSASSALIRGNFKLINGEIKMKLSGKGRYAIKAMINIALNNSKQPKTLLEISKHQGISLSYLEQLFALLRKHNLVSGVRGPGGGYKLSVEPKDISIAQIINAINSDKPAMVGSESKDEVIWDNFSARLCNYLETVTLGSLIEDNNSESINSELLSSIKLPRVTVSK